MTSRRSILAGLLLAALLADGLADGLGRPARAAEPDGATTEVHEHLLCERVVASPVSLRDAIGRATATGRRALAAAFTLDGEQRLVLSVTTVGSADDALDFVETASPVTAAGWSGVDRLLSGVEAVARAARWQTLLALGKVSLSQAVEAMETARRPKEGSPTGRPIGLEPLLLERTPWFEGRVALEGAPWRVHVALISEVRLAGIEPPSYVAAREAAARRWLGKRLPELDVQGARWLNVEVPPTLAGWQGHPVLVVLTNYNCELECGPPPAAISAWERRYGPLGLKVVTLYRDKASWKQEVALEGLPEHVRVVKTTHPVLLDVLDRYIEALEPGPVGYPMVFLLDGEGVVAWESATDRADFQERCEHALRAALAAVPRPPGPQAPGR